MYVIGSKVEENVFWSNEFGWADLDSAERFTIEEKQELNLPMDGYWIHMWSVDNIEFDMIQFVRLLAECNQAGIFTLENLAPVAESMDLREDQILSIIERAENRWEEEQEKIRR
jgi:hypothetical protein